MMPQNHNDPVKIKLGFSPCPNDCFIFDALVHGKIDTEGLEFDVLLADVEELNRLAFLGAIDMTKLSYHAFAHLTKTYVLLDAGSALGFGVGPLLISKIPGLIPDKNTRIAIPGKYTTANFLLSLAYPQSILKVEMLFSGIEEAVLSGAVDAGLIIHENRFTYSEKGLYKIADLGEYWEGLANAPIPLGGIVVKRELPDNIKRKVNQLLRKSVEYAFANPDASRNFVRAHAQEMSEEVMYKHINLYVNKYSIDLGPAGRAAVGLLFEKARAVGVINNRQEELFLKKES